MTPAVSSANVSVVLALYNGASHVGQQLASVVSQTHPPFEIVICDDGSQDDGPAQVRAVAARTPQMRWHFQDGPRQGFAANFLAGLHAVGDDVNFVALSDQDDVWLPEKLARAVTALHGVNGPAALCGSTFVCDANLANPRQSRAPAGALGFDNALVQNVMAGNTIVMNRAALDSVRQASTRAQTVVAHDWWIYQVLTGVGAHIIWDDTPQVMYRQHGGNLIGANTGLWAKIVRLQQMFAGRYRRWNDVNLAALHAAQDMLTPQARDQITAFGAARRAPFWRRISALRASGVRRQSALGQASLYLAAFVGRI